MPPATDSLLERSAEREAIADALDSAGAGSGTTLIVAGPAGIGKTSLLRELRAEADRRNVRVLRASGSPLESGFGFGAATELLSDAVLANPDLLAGTAELARHLFYPDASEPVALPGEDAAFPVIHGLHWLVEGLAETGPLALVVDDCHWVDEPSLRFLDHLARRIEGSPVLIALAARIGEPPEPPGALTRLLEDAPASEVRPRPLSANAVESVVEGALGEADDQFVRACARASGGNPFYLRALLAEAQRQGLTPTRVAASELTRLRPNEIGARLLARLETFGADQPALAEAIAVLGPGAALADAAALAGLDDEHAARLAEQLRAAEILAGVDPCAFAHAILASAIVERIPPVRRSELHLRAARQLANRGAPAVQVAAQLAPARRCAEPWAWRTLGEAARRARRDGAPAEATRLLGAAIEEGPPPAERGPLLHELALAEVMVGAADDAVGHLSEAVELGGPVAERARACSDLGRLLATHLATPAARRALELGLEIATGEDDEAARQVEMYIVWALIVDPEADPAEATRRGLELAADPDAERTVAGRTMLAQLGTRLALGGKLDDGLGLAERARRGEGAADHSLYTATPAVIAAFTVAERPDIAEEIADGAEVAARQRASVLELGALSYLRAMARDRLGDAIGAATAAEDAIAAVEQGYRYGADLCHGVAARSALERGDAEDAARVLAALDADEWAEQITHMDYLTARAEVALATDRDEDALADATAAIELSNHYGITTHVAVRSTAALALGRLDRTEEARVLAGEELAMAERAGNHRVAAIATRALAIATEEGDERLELLSRSVDEARASVARRELARSLVELGTALRRAQRRREAREPLREGLSLAHDCGCTVLAERAAGELEATGESVRERGVSGVDALTPSELRVADLAAGGASNREIAANLFVSPRTVETHLSHVYRKLDLASRDELAAALRRDAS